MPLTEMRGHQVVLGVSLLLLTLGCRPTRPAVYVARGDLTVAGTTRPWADRATVADGVARGFREIPVLALFPDYSRSAPAETVGVVDLATGRALVEVREYGALGELLETTDLWRDSVVACGHFIWAPAGHGLRVVRAEIHRGSDTVVITLR